MFALLLTGRNDIKLWRHAQAAELWTGLHCSSRLVCDVVITSSYRSIQFERVPSGGVKLSRPIIDASGALKASACHPQIINNSSSAKPLKICGIMRALAR